MDDNTNNSPCQECLDSGVHPPPLADSDHLREHLAERDNRIIALEADLKRCNTHISNLEDQVATWREKYERMYDSHKRVQTLNQNLENKLLQMVDKVKDEKDQLTKDIATLSVSLAESKNNYGVLQKENERYKREMSIAIQLLQCNPDNFVSQKLDSLPLDTQNRVSQYIMSKSRPAGTSSAKNANENENTEASEYEFNVSASLMTKMLAESIQDTVTKHCDTCTCSTAQCNPFTYDDKPVTNDDKPVTNDDKPVTNDDKPVTNDDKPVTNDDQPVIYNDNQHSVATQTFLSGDVKPTGRLDNQLGKLSSQSSPVKAANNLQPFRDLYNHNMPCPMYIIPQPSMDYKNAPPTEQENLFRPSDITNIATAEMRKKYELEATVQGQMIDKIGADLEQLHLNTEMEIERIGHHRFCDRTRLTTGNNNLFVKELSPKNDSGDNVSFRKSSQGSMGCASRASSLAKSTSSANKSNTHVGPGPRFCSLRMQAGSKNILLANAQPDVPPVLYKRQIKYNDELLVKELNEGFDHFVDLEKNSETELETAQNKINYQTPIKKESGVAETTLIDVQVDNINKDLGAIPKGNPINPVLLNVSSSPLQPLKSHSFSNSKENNNNTEPSTKSDLTIVVDRLLTKSNSDMVMSDENTNENTGIFKADCNPPKIFNFDKYEQQSKLSNHFSRPVGVVDLNAIENIKTSPDSPLKNLAPAFIKTESETKPSASSVVNVYPNLTQTHLKANEGKRNFTGQSTSSLSSDDSEALLHKEQLLRVAQWVEKNLEQQMNDVSLEDEINFDAKTPKKEKLYTDETMQMSALNMPHPVSKYSKRYAKARKETGVAKSFQPIRETHGKNVMGTAECVIPECSVCIHEDAVTAKNPEDTYPQMDRIEYSVRKFLDGPSWDKLDKSAEKNRRTGSKTETDV